VARQCSVCSHTESFEINEALVVEKKSNRAVARQYDLHHDSVRRHKEHIPELLVKASEHTEEFEADSILLRIEALERETLDQLKALKEEDEPNRRTILFAIREQRSNIELIARVRQIINDAPQVNILISSHVQQVIIDALYPYPDAKQAVADSLASLEAAS
jgi:hypothetical protein